jgi:hypothetical protein
MKGQKNSIKDKSLIQRFINFLAKTFSIKQYNKKKKKKDTDDIYPLW